MLSYAKRRDEICLEEWWPSNAEIGWTGKISVSIQFPVEDLNSSELNK